MESDSIPTIKNLDLDANPKGYDWIKGKWDLPMPGTPEYETIKKAAGDMPLRPSWLELADGEDYQPVSEV